MSILPQHNFITRSHTHVSTNLCRRSRIISSTSTTTTTTTTPPKRKQTQLSIEPKIEKQTTTATHIATPILNDPSLLSTRTHRIWVAAGCTTVFVSLAKAVVAAAHSHMWLQPVLAGYIGYILADLGSGVYHWGIDNYGDASTPVFGAQIEAFQGHHKWPWTITRRQFANNLHALARVITFIVLPIDLVCNDAVLLGFVSLCSGCIMFSQQFHAWAHSTKSKLSPLVVALQDAGLLVSRSQHADHHRAPYNNNYCIVSGVWNEFLDKNKVFEALEMVFYFQLGVQPRSWTEPNSEWTEDTESTSQVTAH